MARRGVTEFLRAFEDVGQTFFDIESDLLIVLDEHGNIERVNPAFERLLDRKEADVLGLGMIRLICIDDWATFLRSFTSPNQPAVRMLRREQGEIVVKMIAVRFKGQRGFLAFRPVRYV
jgi:PAS domain S-box-containing protein